MLNTIQNGEYTHIASPKDRFPIGTFYSLLDHLKSKFNYKFNWHLYPNQPGYEYQIDKETLDLAIKSFYDNQK